MGRVLIGISTWADPGLAGGFFAEEVKTPAERLRHYAQTFDLAEVDSSFYALPMRSNISLWLASTPPGFVFDIKGFQLFTGHPTPVHSLPRTVREAAEQAAPGKERVYAHHLPEPVVDTIWGYFASVIEPLSAAGKLGAVLFQFPPWFHFSLENLDYIGRCRQKLPQYRVAAEFRTADWLHDEHRQSVLDFLRKHQVALVAVDEPQGLRSSVPPVAEVTAPVAVVRFHGRNAENWEKKGAESHEKYRYLYSEAELKDWVPRIARMAGQAGEVHLIFKNKPPEDAVKNALQMKALLGAARL